jgi:uncharacterized membrane protein YccF (DUF307 family)
MDIILFDVGFISLKSTIIISLIFPLIGHAVFVVEDLRLIPHLQDVIPLDRIFQHNIASIKIHTVALKQHLYLGLYLEHCLPHLVFGIAVHVLVQRFVAFIIPQLIGDDNNRNGNQGGSDVYQ